MFSNIGKKVQAMAKVVCWLGIILSVVSGVKIMRMGGNVATITGVITIVVGILCAWIGSWVTYAVGEIAEYAEKH